VRTAALKPAETGCDPDPADGRLLASAAGTCPVPFTYRLPVAPAVAARLEGKPFTLPPVLAAFDALDAEFCLVEGAGGLLVPFADDVLGADIAAALGLPVLIVARASLGTINHTVLTVLAARGRGLTVAGVILNRVSVDIAGGVGPDESYNVGEIKRHARVDVLGIVPHTPPPHEPSRLADAVERAFDPISLR